MRSPAEFRRILIIGAGAFGREVVHWATAAWPSDARRISGFLSAHSGRLDGHASPLAVIDDPETYEFEPGDACLLAIGIPGVRRQVAESVLARGAEFLMLTDSPSKSAVCPLERMNLLAPLLQTHRPSLTLAEQLAAQAKPPIPAPKVADDVAGLVAAVSRAAGGRHG